MNNTKHDSGASAEKKVGYTTIFLEDIDWIIKTKGAQNREQRINEVIEKYRGEFGE